MIVRPTSRKEAKEYCRQHPHAASLPNSSKYYFAAFEKNKFLGLAVWGWGIVPARTPKKLFGEGTSSDYLELSRFFVVDSAAKNTASQFLSLTIKLIKKYNKKVKWLYTYAAGFQGLIGIIYKACGFKYIGRQKCCFPFIAGRLVHPISIYHRYKKTSPKYLKQIFGNKYKMLYGYNFRYIKFLRDEEELMKKARFKVLDYPAKKDIEIWDEQGNKIDPLIARKIPLVKLKSKIMRG